MGFLRFDLFMFSDFGAGFAMIIYLLLRPGKLIQNDEVNVVSPSHLTKNALAHSLKSLMEHTPLNKDYGQASGGSLRSEPANLLLLIFRIFTLCLGGSIRLKRWKVLWSTEATAHGRTDSIKPFVTSRTTNRFAATHSTRSGVPTWIHISMK